MKRYFLPALTGTLLLICRFVVPPAHAETTPVAPVPPPITVTLQIMPNPARRGTNVGFSLTARNTTQTTQTLRFNSGQSFEITATPEAAKDGEAVWHWSHGKFFTQSLRSEKLAPGQAKTWTATWNQSDDRAATLPRGKYTITARVTANGGLKAVLATLELTD